MEIKKKKKIIQKENYDVKYLINPRRLCIKDYRVYQKELSEPLKLKNGIKLNYKIEPVGGRLAIKQYNFVGFNTKDMYIHIDFLNMIHKRLSAIVGRDWVPLNKLMPIFEEEFNYFRKNYLGLTKPLKTSSYQRHFYIFFLLWKTTRGSLGFIAEHTKNSKHTLIDIKKKKIEVGSVFDPHGYKVKACGQVVILLEDTAQTKLIC